MWAISYFINNDVLCTSDLTLICHLTKIGRNVTFVFFKQKQHKVDEKSQIRCVIIDTNSGIVRTCHLRHVFCVIYGRLDGYFMERLSKAQGAKELVQNFDRSNLQVKQDSTKIKDSEEMLHTRLSGALVQICCSSFVWSSVALLRDEVMKSKHLETLQN